VNPQSEVAHFACMLVSRMRTDWRRSACRHHLSTTRITIRDLSQR